ncbi:ICMT-domain-containing protein [Dichomitus squalens LYAD-421 SS1]|uniref:Protein-S-isoprenylcysteine O-methyltransferase n=1 Tax=Dichomitus squalens (strain LYAD-421) TaxID=732165 RepID=R7SQ56_DICSQ|nr:ICMT-domain-containing protein [Dichomitus squalens LYAD-421 SS1]EJF58319.1 ICMT-domain-containing protein [Dichomitus squalens LYAD-421 SS1]
MNLLYLAKVPAFVMMIIAENTSFRPPKNPFPQPQDLQKFGAADLITSLAGWFPIIGVGIDCSFHLCEVVAVLAREYPSPLSDRVLAALFKNTSRVDNLAISPAFVVAFLLLVLGAAWRKICYDTLGRFFTFQLAVLKEHKLVTTGPYSVVRHPAYTAFVMTDVGCLMALLLPGSYIYESGMLEKPWVVVGLVFWAVVHVAIALTAVKRIPVEDEVLHKEFGSQWEEWARKTPYKLIPYVY